MRIQPSSFRSVSCQSENSDAVSARTSSSRSRPGYLNWRILTGVVSLATVVSLFEETQAQFVVEGGRAVVVADGMVSEVNAASMPAIPVTPEGAPPPAGPPGTPTPPAAAPGSASPASQEGPARPQKPSEPPDKKEFDVKPDEQGMVEFHFRNQAWPDILKWLAEISQQSLDWQELPNDHLNIATNRKQSLADTRDLINRHLLARGYTMLELDGVIQVAKTAGINVSLVPKVPASALESLPPSRFVRTTIPLSRLIASIAATEFKHLISSNGALHPLDATNRLEAMDSAANLAEIYRLIQEEESEESVSKLAREFELEYVRAIEVREQLLSFLGIESKSAGGSKNMSPQEMMMQQQQMQMQMQMQQQQAMGGGPPGGKKSADIYIVANSRRNSLIAHAPPDKMAIIEAFIKRVDVQSENAMNLQRLESRMKIYRLSSLDPKQLVASMIAMDALEPSTRLEVDEKNRAIIAYASLADQMMIQQTIQRLDGSARDFEVIQLRRLLAEDVAGTIKFLMGTEQPKDTNKSRRNMYYFDPFSFNQPEEEKNTDSFRVGANSQDNQLLLWANEIEIQEVNNLLVKLGEIPAQGAQRSQRRTVDASRSPETRDYLKRLQESWAKVSSTPLVIPDDIEFQDPSTNEADPTRPPATDPSTDKASESEGATSEQQKNDGQKVDEKSSIPTASSDSEPKSEDKLESATDDSESISQHNDLHTPVGRLSNANLSTNESPGPSTESVGGTLASSSESAKSSASAIEATNAQLNAISASSASSKDLRSRTNPESEPIEIGFDANGNLVLAGKDLDALDQLEQLMASNKPPQQHYDVFYIKHTKPSWIVINLKDYFKEEEEPKNNRNSYFSWLMGEDDTSQKQKNAPQLGKQRKLRFISDTDTQSIIVIGADDRQRKTIKGLIELWDVPEKTNRQKLRFTKLVQIQHSKADSIVDAIKDAYRDLLSTNDKAFQKPGGEAGGEAKHDSQEASVSAGGGMSYAFSGRLSMGIDRITNSVIVSAEGEDLLALVVNMIQELDVAAQPTGAVQLIELGGTNSKAMEQALKALIGRGGADKNGVPPNQQGIQPGNPQNGHGPSGASFQNTQQGATHSTRQNNPAND